jgi:hypothetical protein
MEVAGPNRPKDRLKAAEKVLDDLFEEIRRNTARTKEIADPFRAARERPREPEVAPKRAPEPDAAPETGEDAQNATPKKE